MTAKQTALYWQAWGTVRAWALKTPEPQGLAEMAADPAQKDALKEVLEEIRKGGNRAASNGVTDSSSKFTNADLTRWLGWCESMTGRPEAVITRELQAAQEERDQSGKWEAQVRDALAKLGKGEGYAVAIARRRGLAHVGSLSGLSRAEALVILAPLRAQLRRAGL